MPYRGMSGGLHRTRGGYMPHADSGPDTSEDQDDLADQILARRAAYERAHEDPGHHFTFPPEIGPPCPSRSPN